MLDEFAAAQDDLGAERAFERAAAASLKADRLNRELKRVTAERDELAERIALLSAVDGVSAKAPKGWEKPKKKAHRHVGIANMLLSDLHLDEVVNPAEVGHQNAYNRKVAQLRLRACFDKFLLLSRDYIGGIDYEGAAVPLLGDIFSGNIHEELRETNEVGILESIDFWLDEFVAGYRLLADGFGRVHVPVVVGNHGRLTRKPIHKGAVRDNYDWLFCRQLARAFADDPRVTFDIPDATWAQMTQYGTTFHYEHGDRGFSGGGGIAGIFSPLLRGDLKLRKRQGAFGKPYDVLCLGHFHTYLPVPSYGFIANGSTKGLDDYAASLKLGYEPPQQAYWVTTPESGVSFSAPILCGDRAKEKW